MNYNCSKILNLRHLQDKFKKAFKSLLKTQTFKKYLTQLCMVSSWTGREGVPLHRNLICVCGIGFSAHIYLHSSSFCLYLCVWEKRASSLMLQWFANVIANVIIKSFNWEPSIVLWIWTIWTLFNTRLVNLKSNLWRSQFFQKTNKNHYPGHLLVNKHAQDSEFHSFFWKNWEHHNFFWDLLCIYWKLSTK